MSGKRPPAPPPALAGFTYVEVLGSGGFADVYLYEQQLPRRRVAVKVLLADRMGAGAAEQFAAEANVMALLSTHPAIVTIYQAGVSDDGRPYLVMEYCSRPNLQVRSRAQAFSVAEALRVGVQVAAAVETAHRAGILHRDIKPANILVTEYNRPALTDFGIATTAGAEESSTGMSIPWSPPEAFSDQPASGVATDVYALGATVYTLLAGRSPFEQPGGRNSGADLIQRIETEPAAPLGRPDVPASLEAVLEAMPAVWKFVVTHRDAGRLAGWYAEAETMPAFGVEYSWHDRIDVMPAGRSKGSRLFAWAAERGIDRADIVAFGDNFNDLAMLTGAGLGIAMGNAPEGVKAAVAEVIGGNDTDAIAERIERLLA